jgi:hypothetical protein
MGDIAAGSSHVPEATTFVVAGMFGARAEASPLPDRTGGLDGAP